MIDYHALLLGSIAGLPVSLIFFWGLAIGMRKALASPRPVLWLLASFALRSLWVVLCALLLIRWLEPLSALLGLMLAFFCVRMITVWWVRHRKEART